jgi:hypothetical protein
MAHVFANFTLSICLSKELGAFKKIGLINMAIVNSDLHALITYKGISCPIYASTYTSTFSFAALRHWLEL